MSDITRKEFAEALCQISSRIMGGDSIQTISQDLMRSWLKFASASPDNLNAFKYIEYGKVFIDEPLVNFDVYGFKIKDKDILLHDITNYLETVRRPQIVREVFPNLTYKEWDACLRIVTTLLQTFLVYGEIHEKEYD